jgi:MoaA/NifB/PqqE/SkfB family radical SAM enzyme
MILDDQNKIHTIEPAYVPIKKMSFLIDWLITLKCNYECSYCPIGPTGHDNRRPHPAKEKCLKMLDQMYRYVDVMMQYKNTRFKDAILNIYGGEALYHPNIEEILIGSTKNFEKYSTKWTLKRRMTTNASAQLKTWENICEHIEGFTLSYHSQSSKKMKDIFKNNLEHLIKIKKEYDIVILMYPHKEYWNDCVEFLKFCQQNKLNFRPRLLDGDLGVYNQEQLNFLKEFFQNKKGEINFNETVPNKKILNQGRVCCGGRSLCVNRDLKKQETFIPRDFGFEGWYCSANWYFLMANADTEEFFTNRDCLVKLDSTRGPLATINTMDSYIEKINDLLKTNKLPVMKCVQKICKCGTCAPKSLKKETLYDIMKIYNTADGAKNFIN